MGCGASKATSVVPSDSTQPAARKNSNNHSTTHVSPLSSGNISDDEISIAARASQGLAFEVPLHDDSDDSNSSSLIKKHPPKRFQRLEDQQITPLTHELLDEKQAEAEQRRQQILSQRVQSAKARQKLKRNLLNGESEEILNRLYFPPPRSAWNDHYHQTDTKMVFRPTNDRL